MDEMGKQQMIDRISEDVHIRELLLEYSVDFIKSIYEIMTNAAFESYYRKDFYRNILTIDGLKGMIYNSLSEYKKYELIDMIIEANGIDFESYLTCYMDDLISDRDTILQTDQAKMDAITNEISELDAKRKILSNRLKGLKDAK